MAAAKAVGRGMLKCHTITMGDLMGNSMGDQMENLVALKCHTTTMADLMGDIVAMMHQDRIDRSCSIH